MVDLSAVCGALVIAVGAPGFTTPAPRVPWYAVRATRDLTGDGWADTLTLEAFGTRPDSLKIIFRIRGANREIFHAEWSSHGRYLDILDGDGVPTIPRDSLARLVRTEMNQFFDSTNFETAEKLPFRKTWHVQEDGDDPRDYIAHEFQYNKEMAARERRGKHGTPDNSEALAAFDAQVAHATFDTARVRAIGSEIQRLRLPTFTFSYGYESTETIAWSPKERRFFEVFYGD